MKGKKVKLLILAALFLILIVLLLSGLPYAGIFVGMFRATGLNYTDHVTEGSFAFLTRDERPGTLFYSKQGKKAAVYGVTYDPASSDTVIVIPDSYGDYPVEGLGGYMGRGAPSPFEIYLKGVHSTHGVGPSDGSFDWYTKDKNMEIVYVDLELQIGPNIREIFADQSGLETGSKLYVPRVYITCDPENRWFYSVDGRLYQKNGKPVKGFIYWDKNEE